MKKSDLNLFYDKKILVTGGAGSIGSELVRQLLDRNPAVVRVLDNNESGLFQLEKSCKEDKYLRLLVGDIRDKDRVMRAMEGVDYVFHTSALKHVYMNEYNAFETVKTNVLGTMNIIEAAIANNVGKVVNISTDKSVNPTTIMGTTKLLGEKLISTANYHKGDNRTIFCSVRFGNVMASSGSVIPIFLNQIENNEPVTVTDPDMTRFMMSISDAVKLVLKAAVMAENQSGEIFVLKMPIVRIGDLAEVMIEEYGDILKHKIKIIGAKPSEKMDEELLTEYEAQYAEERDGLIVISPAIDTTKKGLQGFESIAARTAPRKKFVMERKRLTKDEIAELLDDVLG